MAKNIEDFEKLLEETIALENQMTNAVKEKNIKEYQRLFDIQWRNKLILKQMYKEA